MVLGKLEDNKARLFNQSRNQRELSAEDFKEIKYKSLLNTLEDIEMEIKIEESLVKQNDLLLKEVEEQKINLVSPALIDRVSHQWCDDTFGPEFFGKISKYFAQDQLAKSFILR